MLTGQILRYGLVGGLVTALQAMIYWLLSSHQMLSPQGANVVGYLAAVVSGYFLHGRVTFRDANRNDRDFGQMVRFVTVSLLSLGLNAFWVWLAVSMLHGPLWLPIPAMAVVTPGFVFILNRQWVFRGR